MENEMRPVLKPYQSEITDVRIPTLPARPYASSLQEIGTAVVLPGNTKSQRNLTHLKRYIERAKVRGLDVSRITSRSKIGR
jgi:hypothetical protein